MLEVGRYNYISEQNCVLCHVGEQWCECFDTFACYDNRLECQPNTCIPVPRFTIIKSDDINMYEMLVNLCTVVSFSQFFSQFYLFYTWI